MVIDEPGGKRKDVGWEEEEKIAGEEEIDSQYSEEWREDEPLPVGRRQSTEDDVLDREQQAVIEDVFEGHSFTEEAGEEPDQEPREFYINDIVDITRVREGFLNDLFDIIHPEDVPDEEFTTDEKRLIIARLQHREATIEQIQDALQASHTSIYNWIKAVRHPHYDRPLLKEDLDHLILDYR